MMNFKQIKRSILISTVFSPLFMCSGHTMESEIKASDEKDRNFKTIIRYLKGQNSHFKFSLKTTGLIFKITNTLKSLIKDGFINPNKDDLDQYTTLIKEKMKEKYDEEAVDHLITKNTVSKAFKHLKEEYGNKDQELPKNETVPLSQISTDRIQRGMIVVNAINPHFGKPYEDEPENSFLFALPCPNNMVVYRPNHSLPHGLRQGYLAVDCVLFLIKIKSSESEGGKSLIVWLKDESKRNPKFLEKLEFSSAFQRSGRRSEQTQDLEKSAQYLNTDLVNFENGAKDLIGSGKLFENDAEFNLYKQALNKEALEKIGKLDPGIEESKTIVTPHLSYLAKIFYVAHILDLRRLPSFTKERILKDIAQKFFGTDHPNNQEKWCIDQLWARTGEYLEATGDRDMDDPKKFTWNRSVFCQQAYHPELMVRALEIARTKPEQKLLQSIVNHTQVMRELKERYPNKEDENPLFEKTRAQKQKAIELRETLENAPYTASEGALKIYLGDKYEQIPRDATEEEARKLITHNILTFLSESKRVGDKLNPKNLLPRIEDPDEEYLRTLVDCMMEERKNRGKIVQYHTTDPEMGFQYDIYTQLRNQLAMAGDDKLKALRAIDTAFLCLDKKIGRKANVDDFVTEFTGVKDYSSTGYQDLGLSTNFSLFGSDQKIQSASYSMFYDLKDKLISVSPPSYEGFFGYINQNTGIPGDYASYKPILNRFIMMCQENKPCNNGRLLQIFIEPEVIQDITYLSAGYGVAIQANNKTLSLDIPVTLLRTKPTRFISFLETLKLIPKGKDLVKNYVSDPDKLAFEYLQGRIFLRPEIMFNPRLVMINAYWRFGAPQDQATYTAQIKELVNQSLVSWLQEGAPALPEAFIKGANKLKEFTKMVYKGSTGSDAPSALAITQEDRLKAQLVTLLQSKKNKEALLFLENHFQGFSDKPFIIPFERNGKGGGQFTLKELLLKFPDSDLMAFSFDKGIFLGGETVYKTVQLMGMGIDNRYYILKKILNFKEPSKTCNLYHQHFDNQESHCRVSIIEGINAINNDESIILQSKPIFDVFGRWNYDRDIIFKSIYEIPATERTTIIEKALSLVSYIKDWNINSNDMHDAANNFNILTEKIIELTNLNISDEIFNYLFKMVIPMTRFEWKIRIGIIDLLQKLDANTLKRVDSVIIKNNIYHRRSDPSGYKPSSYYLNNRKEFLGFINTIISRTMDMKNHSDENYEKEISSNEEIVTYLTHREAERILLTINWTYAYRASSILVPFSAQDVISYAKIKPEDYDLKFIESDMFRLLFNECIRNFNYPALPSARSIFAHYNRIYPNDDNNKAIIARYICELYKISTPK